MMTKPHVFKNDGVWHAIYDDFIGSGDTAYDAWFELVFLIERYMFADQQFLMAMQEWY